jgi:putative glutamine amidotransferase
MGPARPRIAIPEPTSGMTEYNDRCWPQYAHAVEACGGEAVRVALRQSQAEMARLISTCSGILLPGSPADVDPQKYGRKTLPECGMPDPLREAADELLLQEAYNLHKPLLGICYGLQSLNIWRNGTLEQHLHPGRVDHDAGPEVLVAHTVEIEAGSLLAAVVEDASDAELGAGVMLLETNSSHHQAVETAGDGLAVVSRAADDGTIEALEGRGREHWVLGVQWHPERTLRESPASEALFHSFVEAARAWKPRAVRESVGS